MATVIVAGIIKHFNAVPNFDDDGRPDLEAWDDALAEHEDSEEIWAYFSCEELAKLSKNLVVARFEERKRIESTEPTCDEVSLLWEERKIKRL